MDGHIDQHTTHYSESDAEIATAVILEEIDDLKNRLVLQKAEAAQKEREASQTEAEIDANRRLLERIRRKIIASNCARPEKPSGVTSVVACGAATVEDIQTCRFQHEAFRRIAEMNQGVLVLSDAADLVIAALQPKGTKNSVLVGQRRMMQQNHDWERVSRGTYQLTKFAALERRDEADARPTNDIAEHSSDEGAGAGRQAA